MPQGIERATPRSSTTRQTVRGRRIIKERTARPTDYVRHFASRSDAFAAGAQSLAWSTRWINPTTRWERFAAQLAPLADLRPGLKEASYSVFEDLRGDVGCAVGDIRAAAHQLWPAEGIRHLIGHGVLEADLAARALTVYRNGVSSSFHTHFDLVRFGSSAVRQPLHGDPVDFGLALSLDEARALHLTMAKDHDTREDLLRRTVWEPLHIAGFNGVKWFFNTYFRGIPEKPINIIFG